MSSVFNLNGNVGCVQDYPVAGGAGWARGVGACGIHLQHTLHRQLVQRRGVPIHNHPGAWWRQKASQYCKQKRHKENKRKKGVIV